MNEHTGTIEPAVAPAAPPPREKTILPLWSAAAFVWGVWACLLVAGLGWVYHFSTNTPYCEDFLVVRFVVGEEDLTLDWLWQQESEHRPFLPKLLAVVLPMLTQTFRIGLFLYNLGLAALAAGLILAVRRMRGRTTFADAFIPLALLWLCFTGEATWYTSRIYYLLPTYLAGVILLVILSWGVRLGLWAAIAAGLCLALMPLCGGPGLVYLPALGTWYLVCALVSWFSCEPEGKRNSIVMLGLLGVTAGVVWLYFRDYKPISAEFAPPSPDPELTAAATLAALTNSIGPGASSLAWPVSGVLMLVLCVLTAVALLAVLLRSWRTDRSSAWGLFSFFSMLLRSWREPNCSHAWGLFFFLGAAFTNALALGWGRGTMGVPVILDIYAPLTVLTTCAIYGVWALYQSTPQSVAAGQIARAGSAAILGTAFVYALVLGWAFGGGDLSFLLDYSAPVLALLVLTACAVLACAIYVVWVLYKPASLIAAAGPVGLLAVAMAALPCNVQVGLDKAEKRHAAITRFHQELIHGARPYELVARHSYSAFGLEEHKWLAYNLELLRKADLGLFGLMKENPRLVEMKLPLTPAESNEFIWYNPGGSGTGEETYLLYKLPRPIPVAYLRFHCYINNGSYPPNLRVYWRDSTREEFLDRPHYHSLYGANNDVLTIYVADIVDEFRIHPDAQPFEMEIYQVTVAMPLVRP